MSLGCDASMKVELRHLQRINVKDPTTDDVHYGRLRGTICLDIQESESLVVRQPLKEST